MWGSPSPHFPACFKHISGGALLPVHCLQETTVMFNCLYLLSSLYSSSTSLCCQYKQRVFDLSVSFLPWSLSSSLRLMCYTVNSGYYSLWLLPNWDFCKPVSPQMRCMCFLAYVHMQLMARWKLLAMLIFYDVRWVHPGTYFSCVML